MLFFIPFGRIQPRMPGPRLWGPIRGDMRLSQRILLVKSAVKREASQLLRGSGAGESAWSCGRPIDGCNWSVWSGFSHVGVEIESVNLGYI